MHEVEVIGPVEGRYHVGYYVGAKFYSFHQFISKDLAELTAWRMNQNTQKGFENG